MELRDPITTEKVAYWFFRLNGCLTIINFIVHPDLISPGEPRSQRTDVDILATRFPHRCELYTSGNPMKDHKVFLNVKKIDIILAEVKIGRCELNGPWVNRPAENIHRVLYAIGAFPEEKVPEVGEEIYKNCYYENDSFVVRLFAIGKRKNEHLSLKIVQLTWEEILKFIYWRFKKYQKQKAQHEQWDNVGKTLYELSKTHDEDSFIKTVMEEMEKNQKVARYF